MIWNCLFLWYLFIERVRSERRATRRCLCQSLKAPDGCNNRSREDRKKWRFCVWVANGLVCEIFLCIHVRS
jgi:hypothetical protein